MFHFATYMKLSCMINCTDLCTPEVHGLGFWMVLSRICSKWRKEENGLQISCFWVFHIWDCTKILSKLVPWIWFQNYVKSIISFFSKLNQLCDVENLLVVSFIGEDCRYRPAELASSVQKVYCKVVKTSVHFILSSIWAPEVLYLSVFLVETGYKFR